MPTEHVIRGVIFDLDGVLVSTDELHYRAWKRIADEQGIYFDRQINHRLRGVSRMASLEIILERAACDYTAAEKNALAERKNVAYRESLSELSPADVLPGVRELLAGLRQRGIKLAVASSSRNAKFILERIGLAAAFDATADGSDITRTKPDPQVLLIAAARLGLPPEECLVVEDAEAGIEAARRAGMAAFGIGPAVAVPGIASAPSLAKVAATRLLGLSTENVG